MRIRLAAILLLIFGVVIGMIGTLFPGPFTGIFAHPLALPFVVLGVLLTVIGSYLLVTLYFRR